MLTVFRVKVSSIRSDFVVVANISITQFIQAMDTILDESVQLLHEAATSSQGKRIFRQNYKVLSDSTFFMKDNYEDRANFELTHPTDYQLDATNFSCSNYQSLSESVRLPLPTDNLYVEFFEILQTHLHSNDLLPAIAAMSRCCTDMLSLCRETNAKPFNRKQDETWLLNERNTWRLMYILYTDRLNSYAEMEESCYYGLSEKYAMLNLFKRNSLVRECQLVIDWLECNAAQTKSSHEFSDSSSGWENSLHQLKSRDTIVFEASRKIVSNLHPDAPHFENLPLHDIDHEDDKKLCFNVYHKIRNGKLAEAQELCRNSGHFWRSAQLEGWKLFHNPNIEAGNEFDEGCEEGQELACEGNEFRDLWKSSAWDYCNTQSIDKYERASIGAFCGNLAAMLQVCSTWDDFLWAYMRIMIDIRVETELRENVSKVYKVMPKLYWDQKMSINEIFAALESSKHKSIKNEALMHDHIIQKFIILDEISNLIEVIADWLQDGEQLSSQFLRFLTHLLLFLEQIDQVHNRDILEKVIEEYLKYLIHSKQTQLVAFYASKLNESTQISIYAAYLETITDQEERSEALRFAEDCGLNVHAVTKQIVESIRSKCGSAEFKISSLDWLLFHSNQLVELLLQSNALIFNFLYKDNNLDCARLAFNKVPAEDIAKLSAEKEMPEIIHQIICEYMSYKAYFDAQEAFNAWFSHVKSKPTYPEAPLADATFAKKVEYEHKVSQFTALIGRWKIGHEEMSKVAATALYNVLLFPDGGWLQGATDAQQLQAEIIPQCILLLYNVLYDSQQYEECIQLADLLACEKTKLYRFINVEKMEIILKKLAEVSIALLHMGKDPWGNETH